MQSKGWYGVRSRWWVSELLVEDSGKGAWLHLERESTLQHSYGRVQNESKLDGRRREGHQNLVNRMVASGLCCSLEIGMQDATGRIFRLYLEFLIQVHVDDINLHLEEDSADLHERTRDLSALLKAEMKKSKIELSVTEDGKEGKSKVEVFNPYIKRRLKWYRRNEGLGMNSNIEYLKIDKLTREPVQGD